MSSNLTIYQTGEMDTKFIGSGQEQGQRRGRTEEVGCNYVRERTHLDIAELGGSNFTVSGW